MTAVIGRWCNEFFAAVRATEIKELTPLLYTNRLFLVDLHATDRIDCHILLLAVMWSLTRFHACMV